MSGVKEHGSEKWKSGREREGASENKMSFADSNAHFKHTYLSKMAEWQAVIGLSDVWLMFEPFKKVERKKRSERRKTLRKTHDFRVVWHVIAPLHTH